MFSIVSQILGIVWMISLVPCSLSSLLEAVISCFCVFPASHGFGLLPSFWCCERDKYPHNAFPSVGFSFTLRCTTTDHSRPMKLIYQWSDLPALMPAASPSKQSAEIQTSRPGNTPETPGTWAWEHTYTNTKIIDTATKYQNTFKTLNTNTRACACNS